MNMNNQNVSQLSNIPIEVICMIMQQMDIVDLVRIERTCKQIQHMVLREIQKRIENWNQCSRSADDQLRMLVHLSEQEAKPCKFDPITRKVTCKVPMDPVEIRLCWDHRRQVHCQLLERQSNAQKRDNVKVINDGIVFTLEPSTPVGQTTECFTKGKFCEIDAAVTKEQDCGETMYALKVTELRVPLELLASC
jgi:hypothetical protein